MPMAVIFEKECRVDSLFVSSVNWLHRPIDVGIAHDANGRQQISSKQSQRATCLPNGASQRSADGRARHWTFQSTGDGDGEGLHQKSRRERADVCIAQTC